MEWWLGAYDFPVNSNYLLNGGMEANSYWAGSMDQGSFWFDSVNYMYGSRGLSIFTPEVSSNSGIFFVSSANIFDDGFAVGPPFSSLAGNAQTLMIEAVWPASYAYRTYFRVSSLNIPQGATINSADLFIMTGNNQLPANYVKLAFFNAADTLPPSSPNFNYICSADLTAAYKNFTFAGSYYQGHLIDCRDMLQEIVDLPGWNENNSIIAIFVPLSSYVQVLSREYALNVNSAAWPKLIANWTF